MFRKSSLKIVANLQKGFLEKSFFLEKGFEKSWKIMVTSSKDFCLKKAQRKLLPNVLKKCF